MKDKQTTVQLPDDEHGSYLTMAVLQPDNVTAIHKADRHKQFLKWASLVHGVSYQCEAHVTMTDFTTVFALKLGLRTWEYGHVQPNGDMFQRFVTFFRHCHEQKRDKDLLLIDAEQKQLEQAECDLKAAVTEHIERDEPPKQTGPGFFIRTHA